MDATGGSAAGSFALSPGNTHQLQTLEMMLKSHVASPASSWMYLILPPYSSYTENSSTARCCTTHTDMYTPASSLIRKRHTQHVARNVARDINVQGKSASSENYMRKRSPGRIKLHNCVAQ